MSPVARTFYKRIEVVGTENVPADPRIRRISGAPDFGSAMDRRTGLAGGLAGGGLAGG